MGKVCKFSCALILTVMGLMSCSSDSKNYELVHSHRTTFQVIAHPIRIEYITQDYGWHSNSDMIMTVDGEKITNFEVHTSSVADGRKVDIFIYEEYEID